MVSLEKVMDVLKLASVDGGVVYEENLSICTAEWTLDLVGRAIHCLQGLIKASVVSDVANN